MASELILSLRSGEIRRVEAAVQKDRGGARKAQSVVEAGRLGFLDALCLLKDNGADLNASWRGYRALHALIQERPHQDGSPPESGRMACLEWLLTNGADPDLPGGWPPARAVMCAALTGMPEYIAALQRADPSMDGFKACALGDADRVLRILLDRPGFPLERDIGGLTALQCAAGSRVAPGQSVGIAEMLLDHGAAVDAKTQSWGHDIDALYLAASAKNLPLFELLLGRGGNATEGLVTALWNATDPFAEAALAHGANPDRAVSGGRPLLNDLVRWGRFRQAYWLLSRGASPNVADGEGRTAVDQALSRGNRNILRALLDAGGVLRR